MSSIAAKPENSLGYEQVRLLRRNHLAGDNGAAEPEEMEAPTETGKPLENLSELRGGHL
ncbi:MAG TPA: hypothetical protein VLR92_11465 [Blastocatellia bacterium]|nr:hypothetical protein [Blastocatellia bacterium]